MRTSERTTFPDKRPLLYYITDRKQLAGKSLLRRIRLAVHQGVDFVQIREKDLCDRDLFDLAVKVVKAARGTSCRILVNGRADLALAAGAHGVHLPSRSIRPSDMRTWLPKSFIIGMSTHSVREAAGAAAAGADYVLLGPVYPTPSKVGYGPPLGLACLRHACRILSVPVFGLGGICPEYVLPVLQAGAAGVAGISLFQNAAYFRKLCSHKMKIRVSSRQAGS